MKACKTIIQGIIASFKKNREWLISIIIIAIVCIIIVHVLYKIPAICPFFISTWSSGELLSFLGAIIGAASTIYVLRETIKTTISQQDEDHAYSIRPYIMVKSGNVNELTQEELESSIDVSNDNWKGAYEIYIKVNNAGAGNAVDVKGSFSQSGTENSEYSNNLPPLMVGNTYVFLLRKCHSMPISINIDYSDIANIKHYRAEVLLKMVVIQHGVFVKAETPKIITIKD